MSRQTLHGVYPFFTGRGKRPNNFSRRQSGFEQFENLFDRDPRAAQPKFTTEHIRGLIEIFP